MAHDRRRVVVLVVVIALVLGVLAVGGLVGMGALLSWADDELGRQVTETLLHPEPGRGDYAARLQPGKDAIAGVVRWPDGTPARGATVVAGTKRDGFEGLFGRKPASDPSTTCDERGRFAIGGLKNMIYVVRATATRDEAEGERTSWLATTHAAPGGAELELVFGPLAVIAGRAVDDRGAPLRELSLALRVVSEHEGAFSGSAEPLLVDDGEFEHRAVDPGEWEAWLTSPGHVRSASVRFTQPGTVPRFDVVMPRCGRVRGFVVDAAGKPVAGARVQTTASAAPDEDEIFSSNANRRRSSAKGRFALDDVTPGTVELVATCDGHAASVASVLEIAPGQRVDDVRLALRRGGTIRGRALDASGKPLVGADVFTKGEHDDEARSVTVAGDGSFVIEHVTPGSVQLEVDEDVPLGVARRFDRELYDRTLWIDEGGELEIALGGAPVKRVRVTGVVRKNGPIARARVYFRSERDGAPELDVYTDESGRYAIDLEDRGAYWLQLLLPNDAVAARSVRVPDAETATIDLDLPAPHVAGRVVDADGKPLVARIRARRTDVESSSSTWSSVVNDVTAKDGSFTFDALEPGPWRLTVRPKTKAGTSSALAPSFAVLDLATTPVIEDLVVRLAPGGAIEGVVRGSKGEPIPGARVTARGGDGFDHDHEAPAEERATTDAAGRYRIAGLHAGAWRVRATHDDLASRESAPVDVAAGATARMDVELARGAFLDVALKSADGTARRHGEGAWTLVVDADGRAWPDLEKERYGVEVRRFGPLPPGAWRVRRGDGFAEIEVVLAAGETKAIELVATR